MVRSNDEKHAFSKGNIDRLAYAELVRDYSARVFAICFGILSNRDDAGDITQQAFLKGFTEMDQLRDIDKFGGWITKIAKHMCMELLRKRKRNKIALKHVAANYVKDESTYDQDKYSRLQSALMQLTEEYRLPLMLFYFDGQSTKNIAESLEITIATAQARLSRGRKKLRQLLSTEGGAK